MLSTPKIGTRCILHRQTRTLTTVLKTAVGSRHESFCLLSDQMLCTYPIFSGAPGIRISSTDDEGYTEVWSPKQTEQKEEECNGEEVFEACDEKTRKPMPPAIWEVITRIASEFQEDREIDQVEEMRMRLAALEKNPDEDTSATLLGVTVGKEVKRKILSLLRSASQINEDRQNSQKQKKALYECQVRLKWETRLLCHYHCITFVFCRC